MAALLVACGGGGSGGSGAEGTAASASVTDANAAATAATAASAVTSSDTTPAAGTAVADTTASAAPVGALDALGSQTAQDLIASSTANTTDTTAAAAESPSPDSASLLAPEGLATVQANSTAVAPTLANLAATKRVLLDSVAPDHGCKAAFVPPAWLAATAPVTTAAPITLDAADLAVARTQLTAGPFLKANDYKSGSPDEMARLVRNKSAFLLKGEATWTTTTPASLRATHGTLARDAAFVHLLKLDAAALLAVRSYLLAQAANVVNDFSTQICIRQPDGSMLDAAFGEATWLSRYIVTYDAVRPSVMAPDRLKIENFIRRNAYFLAAQQDYGFNYVFPKRLSGSYAARGASAAPTSDADRWLSQRVDSNGDCQIDAKDDARSYPVYAYARADGTAGPRLPVLTQWWNNRKSDSATAIGLAGVLLGDSELTTRAKRYVMEWLTYSVFADGSEGEFARNNDYCVPNQGLVYGQNNVQAAAILADVLARQGDRSLLDFSTRDGLFGTEAGTGQSAKNIETVIATHLQLARGQRVWYYHRGDQARQSLTADRSLGRMDVRLYNEVKYTDNYHQVGLLLAAKRFPSQPIKGVVLRDTTVTSQRWPGSTGNAVQTGFGSWAGSWTDVMNIYPSAFLLRAP